MTEMQKKRKNQKRQHVTSVKDIDPNVWRRFMAYCKLQDVTAGAKLTEILKNYLHSKL
jgi:hypothetical protein